MAVEANTSTEASERQLAESHGFDGWQLLSADVLLKVAGFLPLASLPALAGACRGYHTVVEDEHLWHALCLAHVPALEFRSPAEQRALGGWRGLLKKRYTLSHRFAPLDQPSQEAQCTTFVEVEDGVRCMHTSGSLLVAGCSSGAVLIYHTGLVAAHADAEDCGLEAVHSFRHHTSWVYSVCSQTNFANLDGTMSARVGSCSRDMTVRLYAGPCPSEQLEHGARDASRAGGSEWRQVFVLEGHTDWIAHIKWSHCGHGLISCGNDGLVIIWNLEHGTQERTFSFPDQRGVWWMELDDTQHMVAVLSTGLGSVISLNYETGEHEIMAVSNMLNSTVERNQPCFFAASHGGLVVAAVNGCVTAVRGDQVLWNLDPHKVDTWLLRPLFRRRIGVMVSAALPLNSMHGRFHMPYHFPEPPQHVPGSSLLFFDLNSGERLSGALVLPTYHRMVGLHGQLARAVTRRDGAGQRSEDLEIPPENAERVADLLRRLAGMQRTQRADSRAQDSPAQSRDAQPPHPEEVRGKQFGEIWAMHVDEARGLIWLAGVEAESRRGLFASFLL